MGFRIGRQLATAAILASVAVGIRLLVPELVWPSLTLGTPL